MIYPTCGKVLVIDDQIVEAKPLINLLSSKGVPVIYYSGNPQEFPAKPFDDIRLVFCDLRLTATIEVKSVVANIVAILRAVVSKQNGPYILLVWSTCEEDYLETLNEILSREEIMPVFVLPLHKADYFETQNIIADALESAVEQIDKIELDFDDEQKVKDVIDSCFLHLASVEQKPKEDALQNMEQRLTEELTKANLMHLFILWENTIGLAASNTVNNIYQILPETIAPEQRLRAMLYYLAQSKLEQKTSESSNEVKFEAAMESLNEMFAHFCADSVHKLSFDEFPGLTIQFIEGTKDIQPARLNRWIMTTTPSKVVRIGNVYSDADKTFRFHGLIKPSHSIQGECEKYIQYTNELLTDTRLKYVLLDISSECDVAQNKHYLTRVVPGVMIPPTVFNTYVAEKKLEDKRKDYIYRLNTVEINGEVWHVLFNLNQLGTVEHNQLNDDAIEFALAHHYVTSLKQDAARCISRQGVEMFSMTR